MIFLITALTFLEMLYFELDPKLDSNTNQSSPGASWLPGMGLSLAFIVPVIPPGAAESS